MWLKVVNVKIKQNRFRRQKNYYYDNIFPFYTKLLKTYEKILLIQIKKKIFFDTQGTSISLPNNALIFIAYCCTYTPAQQK